MVEPGFNVDLFVRTDLRTMTAIWMGLETVAKAIDEDRLTLTGDKALQKNMMTWLGLSIFAGVPKQACLKLKNGCEVWPSVRLKACGLQRGADRWEVSSDEGRYLKKSVTGSLKISDSL